MGPGDSSGDGRNGGRSAEQGAPEFGAFASPWGKVILVKEILWGKEKESLATFVFCSYLPTPTQRYFLCWDGNI